MMQMLAAGGVPVLTDDFRRTDIHNPRGYFEYQPALNLGARNIPADWLANARGKAVKVMAYQLKYLPSGYEYKVVFMRRKIAEVLASCEKMKMLRPKPILSGPDQIMAFKTEYAIYEAALEKQPHLRALFVQYNDLLASPDALIVRICDFLGLPMNAEAMAAAIDPALYRNRF